MDWGVRFNDMGRVASFIASAAILLCATGCATLVARGPDRIPIKSVPIDARVYLDGKYVGNTPVDVALERNQNSHLIVVEKEGYTSARIEPKKVVNGWVFGNILLGGLIGLAIDAAANNLEKFPDAAVKVSLDAAPAPATPQSLAAARVSQHIHETTVKKRVELDAAWRVAEEDRYQRERAVWQREHNAWKAEGAVIDRTRKPRVLASVATLVAGAAVLTTGIILEANAFAKQRDIERRTDAWRSSVSRSEQDALRASIVDRQKDRDLLNTFGISLICVGGAAIAAAIVLYSTAPGWPKEPAPPARTFASQLRLAPLAGPGLAGLSLGGGL